MFLKYLTRFIGFGLMIYSLILLVRYIRFYDQLSSFGKGELVAYSLLFLIAFALILFSYKRKQNSKP